MNGPIITLKAGALVFTVLWTAWMMWWSGSYGNLNLLLITACGAAVGYLWYRAMRWQFERMGMLSGNDDSAGGD